MGIDTASTRSGSIARWKDLETKVWVWNDEVLCFKIMTDKFIFILSQDVLYTAQEVYILSIASAREISEGMTIA